MAELPHITHRSGDIAVMMGRASNELGAVRDKLIKKGMAYSPAHGDIAFTVPLFGDFMKRGMKTVND